MRKKIFQVKICYICQKEYLPVSGRQKYCVNCGKIEHKRQVDQYYVNDSEYLKLKRKKYRIENKEKIDLYNKENYLVNLERGKKYSMKYRLEHYEETLIAVKVWRETEHGKKICRALSAKRERELGYIVINKIFQGCEGHHINKDYVVFIPKKLHRSIYHSVLKNYNINIMNQLAFDWLVEQLKK